MADKEKRLRKILAKKGFKGKLKSVATLEEAHLICVESRESMSKTIITGKDSYKRFLDAGHIIPEDLVHYLISSNPRNAWHIEHKILSNSCGMLRHKLP